MTIDDAVELLIRAHKASERSMRVYGDYRTACFLGNKSAADLMASDRDRAAQEASKAEAALLDAVRGSWDDK